MKYQSLTCLAIATLVGPCVSQGPPDSPYNSLKGTTFLNHKSPISNFTGRTFLADNICYLDVPNRMIESVFYYRFSSLARHAFYGIQGTGYTITEFIQPVGWAGDFNTIDAASGHHIDEARWLRDQSIVESYIECWTRGSCDSGSYTHVIQHSIESAANVTGNQDFLQEQLNGMIQMWHMWDYTFDKDVGLYYYDTLYDAQEFSLPGYIAANISGQSNWTFPGPLTYRPSLNSYMYANARTIAKTATTVGNSATAQTFNKLADSLLSAMNVHIWNTSQQFFVDNIREGQPGAGQVEGREGVGFYPFRFGIGLAKTYFLPAVRQLFNEQGFKAEYFPTTLEKRNKYFTALKPGTTCCFWNGQDWPFTTSHVLTSLAAIYRLGGATANQYYELISNYAKTQHLGGIPYIAEVHYPEMNAWSSNGYNYSQHYQHSTYINNIITELVGIVPRADDTLEIDPIIPQTWDWFLLENVPYHGFLVTVLYDKTGNKYKVGSGLTVYVNGEKIYNGPGPGGQVQLPSVTGPAVTTIAPGLVNIAANPLGYLPVGSWPRATATFSQPGYDPFKAIDGHLWYDYTPDNRWTNVAGGLSRTNDTLTVQLQRPRTMKGISLGVYADPQCSCPSKVIITNGNNTVLYSNTNFAAKCLSNDMNVLAFDSEVTTDTINVNLFAQPNRAVGVTELQIWVPGTTGPTYYAADAYPTNIFISRFATNDTAVTAFDANSNATATGAVMKFQTFNSAVQFSGIYQAQDGSATPTLSYRNSGTGSITVNIKVNRVDVNSIALPTTGSSYENIKLPSIPLLKGNNFVTLGGSGSGPDGSPVSFETLTF